eukprot:6127196-Amphidinium_carterae.1
MGKPRKDVMKLVRGNSEIDASNGPQAEDKEQSSDEALSVPMEHEDDEGVITLRSQQAGFIQTLLVLPAPVNDEDDASSVASTVLEIDAVHFDL